MTTEVVCRTCGNTEGWHKEMKPRHIFVAEDSDQPDGLDRKGAHKAEKADLRAQGQTKLQVRNQPTDLALRIALIGKGLLSQAEIAAADELLREAMESGNIIVVKNPGGGHSRGSSGQPESSTDDVAVGDSGSSEGGVRPDPGARPAGQAGSSTGAEAEEYSLGT